MMRILIVEDEYTIRILLKMMLQKYGSIDEADSYEQAFSLLEGSTCSRKDHYDIIFLDTVLPGKKNGYDILRRMREYESTHNLKKTPVVMSTGQEKTHVDDKVAVLYDRILTKPYMISDVEEILSDLGLA